MKRERNLLLLTAALSLVLAFVPGAGSGVMGALALPFVAVGWCLRSLSLSGGVGNAVSIILYALICVVPLFFWWRSRRRTEEAITPTEGGYSTKIPESNHENLQNGAAKYALYPVWLLTTEWQGKNYIFAMNGQTGKFVGDLPLDKAAYTKWLFGIAGAVSAACFAISYLLWLL